MIRLELREGGAGAVGLKPCRVGIMLACFELLFPCHTNHVSVQINDFSLLRCAAIQGGGYMGSKACPCASCAAVYVASFVHVCTHKHSGM